MEQVEEKQKREELNTLLKNAMKLLAVFGLVSIITSFVMSGETERQRFATKPEGGIVGPFTVKEKNQVVEFKVRQELQLKGKINSNWSFLTIEVLDSEQEYLFSFGDELWVESGYDEGYYWKEQEYNYNNKVTFPEKGTFYLEIKPEYKEKEEIYSYTSSNDHELDATRGNVNVTVSKTRGSSIPHTVFGIFCFIAAGVVGFVYYTKNKGI